MALQLYHGTDARIGHMTDEERRVFRKEILRALDYMWNLMEPYFQQYDEEMDWAHNRVKHTERITALKDRMNEDDYNKLYRSLSHDKARRDGLKTWQYQDGVLYLTSNLKTAIDCAYRSFVFGELGETVWEMYQGMKALNLDAWNPAPDIQATFDKVERLAKEEHYPIVYVLRHLDPDKLLTDGGDPIPKDRLEYQHNFRYVDESLFLTPNDLEHTIYLRPRDEVNQYKQKQIALYRQKMKDGTT